MVKQFVDLINNWPEFCKANEPFTVTFTWYCVWIVILYLWQIICLFALFLLSLGKNFHKLQNDLIDSYTDLLNYFVVCGSFYLGLASLSITKRILSIK